MTNTLMDQPSKFLHASLPKHVQLFVHLFHCSSRQVTIHEKRNSSWLLPLAQYSVNTFRNDQTTHPEETAAAVASTPTRPATTRLNGARQTHVAFPSSSQSVCWACQALNRSLPLLLRRRARQKLACGALCANCKGKLYLLGQGERKFGKEWTGKGHRTQLETLDQLPDWAKRVGPNLFLSSLIDQLII